MSCRIVILCLLIMICRVSHAHPPEVLAHLGFEAGKVVIKNFDGEEKRIFLSKLFMEREWDERQIYNYVNNEGIPVDKAGEPLLNSDGTPNDNYNVNDFAWRYYPNSSQLPGFVPSEFIFGEKVQMNLSAGLRYWNGETFVFTKKKQERMSIWWWHWDNVGDDNSGDERHFPDGGWYAERIDPVTTRKKNKKRSGTTYTFSSGDHYHWLFELHGGSKKRREMRTGVYMLEVNFNLEDQENTRSKPFYILFAYGLDNNLYKPDIADFDDCEDTDTDGCNAEYWKLHKDVRNAKKHIEAMIAKEIN